MADFCGLCGKKLGILSGYYSVAETKLCDKCYSTYDNCEKQMYSNVGNFEKIQELLMELRKTYKSNKTVEVLINYINELYELKLKEVEEQRIAELKIDEKKIQETDEYTDNGNIASFENEDISSTELNNNAEELRVTTDSIGMFGNIGGKIKTLAQVVTWIGIIGSVICGFVLMGIDEDLIFTGFIIALLGSLSSWVSSFVLYGFGQLIENTDKLVELAKNKKSD